jgi:hypothetical protein
MRPSHAILLSAWTAVACGSREGEPAAGTAKPAGERDRTTTAKETRVFEVKSSADLVNLRAEYMGLWESGFDGLFEVRFASVPYTAAGWDLAPPSDGKRLTAAPTIDVVLRGDSSAPPPPSRVVARSLRAEGLILKVEHGTTELVVRDQLELERCLVVDGRGMEFGMQLIAILGIGDHGSNKTRPVTVRITDAWFVRNFQNVQAAPMLRFGSVDTAPTYFESIEIARSSFLGNAFATELELQFAKQVKISGSLFYKTWPSGVLVSSTSSGEVVIEDSMIFVEDPGHIARHGEESPPIKLAPSTRVYSKVGAGGARPPAGLTAEPGQFRDRASVAAGEDVIAEAARMPATIIPGPELKAKLDAAVPQPN